MTAKEFLPHLDAFISGQEEISGAWNGQDEWYYYAGEQYHEEDATTAQERANAAKTLKAAIEQYDV